MTDEQPLPAALTDPHKLFNHATWQQCYVDFLHAIYKRRRSKGTIKTYDSCLRRFFVDSSKTPDQYHRHHVEAFLNAPTCGKVKSGTEPGAATRNNRLTPLQSFYKYAQNYGIDFHGKQVSLFRGINPTVGIVRAETATERRAFEEDEIGLFFAQIPRDTAQGKRDFALFLFYFLTGRRLSEISNMLWGDIRQRSQFEDGTSGIAYTWKGKGHVAKDKWVEMPLNVWIAIKEYLVASGRWHHMQPENAVFVSKKSQFSQRPMYNSTVGRIFLRYARAAGLRTVGDGGELTTHSWRATYAIESYTANGHDIVKVQAELGHRGIGTTSGYLEKRKRAKANPVSGKISKKYNL